MPGVGTEMLRLMALTVLSLAFTGGCAVTDSNMTAMKAKVQPIIAPVRQLADTAKATYQVNIKGKSAGTAFLYKTSKGLIFVTALHTVLGYENKPGTISVQSDTFSFGVDLVTIPSIKHDVAFFKLPELTEPHHFLYFEKSNQSLESLKFSTVEMTSYGLFHADYRTPFISEGHLQHITPFSLILTLIPSNIGSSGAPVFLKDNLALVGMLTKQITLEDKIERGVTSAISVDVIEALADNFFPE